MSRIIYRLSWARRLDEWPEAIPRPRPRGVKALGRRYESAIALQLGSEAIRGQWWQFKDANGPGICQTDFVIFGEAWTAILESKHTWTAEGMEQLEQLYMPVVEMATNKKVLGVQVCKHLSPHCSGPIYNTLESAVIAARTGYNLGYGSHYEPTRLVTLHWRGFGPMLAFDKQKELTHG